MGISQIHNTQNIEGWDLIEKGFSNQHATLDKKVYEEYEKLKIQLKEFDKNKEQKVKHSFFVMTNIRKQFSSFVKWYKIAYFESLNQSKKKMNIRKIIQHSSFVSNNDTGNNQSPEIKKSTKDLDCIFSPKEKNSKITLDFNHVDFRNKIYVKNSTENLIFESKLVNEKIFLTTTPLINESKNVLKNMQNFDEEVEDNDITNKIEKLNLFCINNSGINLINNVDTLLSSPLKKVDNLKSNYPKIILCSEGNEEEEKPLKNLLDINKENSLIENKLKSKLILKSTDRIDKSINLNAISNEESFRKSANAYNKASTTKKDNKDSPIIIFNSSSNIKKAKEGKDIKEGKELLNPFTSKESNKSFYKKNNHKNTKEVEIFIKSSKSNSGNNGEFSKIVYQNLLNYSKVYPVKFIEKISKGPPNCFRWIVWMISSNIPFNKLETNYSAYLNQEINEKVELQIKKDLKRTFTDETIFDIEDSQNSLYKVLRAFANNDKEVSYCQGMNFIAGFLLIISDFDEVGVFYLMQSLFSTTFANHLGIRGFYIENFPLLKFYLHLFDHFFKLNLPILHQHFLNLNLPADAWVSKWFITLFTICMPIAVTVRIWDCILSYGLNFLIQFTIAFLINIEQKLLDIDDEFDLVDFFKIMTPFNVGVLDFEINIDNLLNEATYIKLDKSIISEVEKSFEKDKEINLKLLDVKYEIKAIDILSMSSCASRVDFSQSEFSRDSFDFRSYNNSMINGRDTRMNLFNSDVLNNSVHNNEIVGNFNIFGNEKGGSFIKLNTNNEIFKPRKNTDSNYFIKNFLNNSNQKLEKLSDEAELYNLGDFCVKSKEMKENIKLTHHHNSQKNNNHSNIIKDDKTAIKLQERDEKKDKEESVKPIIMLQEKASSNKLGFKVSINPIMRSAKTSSCQSLISMDNLISKKLSDMIETINEVEEVDETNERINEGNKINKYKFTSKNNKVSSNSKNNI